MAADGAVAGVVSGGASTGLRGSIVPTASIALITLALRIMVERVSSAQAVGSGPLMASNGVRHAVSAADHQRLV